MISVKETYLYESVLKELNYPYADIFIFDGFIVSEIKQGVNFNWDEHAKHIIEDVIAFLDTDGSNLIYISNRIHSYSVIAQDWYKFFKGSYSLKGYYVVSDRKASMLGFMVENLFFKDKMKRFNSLFDALNWVDKGMNEVA